jgi:lipopolysaccharide/colanic/teichoic acid biosynthesis glycosyltransferase
MNSKKDAQGNLLPDSDRLTPMGIFIRKTSIDELPQLVNVLTGDMSLIGPRPLLIRYLPYYTEEENRRFLIRPGITGLAQISGRNFMSWEDKFKNDIEYMENMSFKNYLIIIWKTIHKVFNPGEIDVDPNSNPIMLAMDLQRQEWDEFKHLKKTTP